jgi:peptidyl-prolyl cis-trans isomerase A (cyclophilin A)
MQQQRAKTNSNAVRLAACAVSVWLALGVAAVRADDASLTSSAPAPAADPPSPPAAQLVEVVLKTQQGEILMALDPVHAPVTTANFLRYVDQKRFDGADFYRAVRIGDDGKYGMLQGGLRNTKTKPFKPIAHESSAVTGLHHTDGAVSMARNAPGTATSEFFIVMGDLTSLDGGDGDPGYAVFGHVETGMDLVKQLLEMPLAANAGPAAVRGQMLVTPVKILSVRRVPHSG